MKKGLLYKLMLFILLTIVLPINAKATITFQTTKTADNLKPGGVSTIIINAKGVTAQDSLDSYDLTFTFDNTKLEYAGGASSAKSNINPISGNTISIKSKFTDAESGDFEVARFNLKVSAGAGSGNAALNLKGTCVSDSSNCQSNGSQITVTSLGNDASLTSLKIPNTTLKPAFSSEVTSYTAVIQDIKELTVNAVAKDPNSKISISENHKALQKGENKIDVVVTSEDGQNRKTYTVVVTLNLTPTEAELLKANANLKLLDVKGEKIDFDPAEKKYYLTVPYTTKKLTITAKPANEKASVEIDGNKKLIVGKNTIKITVVSEDKTKIENYQIIVTRQDQEKEIVQTCPEVTSTKEWIIFSVGLLFTFTLGIILGYFLCKKDIFTKIFTKKEKPVEEAVEIETLSDTIDLSDTVKEVKKKNSKEKK